MTHVGGGSQTGWNHSDVILKWSLRFSEIFHKLFAFEKVSFKICLLKTTNLFADSSLLMIWSYFGRIITMLHLWGWSIFIEIISMSFGLLEVVDASTGGTCGKGSVEFYNSLPVANSYFQIFCEDNVEHSKLLYFLCYYYHISQLYVPPQFFFFLCELIWGRGWKRGELFLDR